MVESAPEELQLEVFKALTQCASVLCSRFSSSQKAKVVQFVTQFSEKNGDDCITAAIGDGTNDIPMLRAASVGIGMFGVESFDAANAGDFAIAQFWFLQRLLLNHGRSSYRRFALVIKYFLYKNLLFVLMLFFFVMQSDWSTQSFVQANLLGLYNILFTSLPIIIAGCLDRDVFNTDMATKHFHELYWPGQRSAYLNLRGLLPWIANAAAHAVIIYFFTQIIFGDPMSDAGLSMGSDATALTTYTTIIVMANVHLGLHLTSFTAVTYLGFWLSVIGWFFFMMLYSALPPEIAVEAYRAFNNIGFQMTPWAVAFIAIQLCSAREALSNYVVFNLYPFAKMSLKRIIQLADSASSRDASTRLPYELQALDNAQAAHKQQGGANSAARTAMSGIIGVQNVTDEDVGRQLNFLFQFKDGEMEEQFIETFLGRMTRYKVGAGIGVLFSGGIVLIQLLSFVRYGGSSLIEIVGWAVFTLAAIFLLIVLCTQDHERLRHYIHQVMLVVMLVAFSGMSIANFRAAQREPDTHPVAMAVVVFGLLIVVRPPLIHIVQYLVLGITALAMWYQIFRVDQWSLKDIALRAIEFIIVFIISLIGLVVGERFDRKLFVMKAAIQRSLEVAREAETRSLVLLNNVLPAGIVAEVNNKRVHRNLSDFSVTLPNASVLQSDIVSFTLFSSTKQPHAVVEMLNSMFKKFDAHVNALGIEKIKTVGDAYVCASGVPSADRQHAEKILSFGLRMVRSIWELNREGVPSIPNLNIQIRVGAAAGPVRAGVIAMEKMRYELFGAVAEECEKMEQTGIADRVQASKSLYDMTSGVFTYEIMQSVKDDGKQVTQYFLKDTGVDPFFSEKTASTLVTINSKKVKDRFRILVDENERRNALLSSQDPTIGGKLAKMNLYMANEDLEQEFRKYYETLADERTNTETAQSTIMYALVASIVGTFAGALHWVVILQIIIASALGLITIGRVGVPLLRNCKDRIRAMWEAFERQIVRGGLDDDDEHYQNGQNLDFKGLDKSSRTSGTSNDDEHDLSRRNSDLEMALIPKTAEGVDQAALARHATGHDVRPLPGPPTFSERFAAWISSPKTTVYFVGIFTLLDPIIVLFAVNADGISRGAVFVTLAAASFIFSQMHLLFMQKIALASVHLVIVSVAFFVRTAVYRSFSGSRDGGDYVGILCCYVLCVGAAYTTERSVRKAFVASKHVERRNAEIGRTLHLCEKLLSNSIPTSIVRRLQEAPDRAVVDEIPEASVLFLYVDGVIPHEHDNDDESAAASSSPGSGVMLNPAGGSNSAFEGTAAAAAVAADTTKHASDDTADVVTRMNDVFYVLDALCRYHLVEKIKTLPFLVVSGCPEPLPKHCHRLACVAKDALAYAKVYNSKRAPGTPELRIRAGLHTGRVTAGVLGTSKFVYDVFGDTVNLSSRLASNAVWGTAACSDAARKHLRNEGVECVERGKVFLKGKGDWLVYEVDCKSLRVDTPEFIDDIDTYLETAPAAVRRATRDPHTARWSMKSSQHSDSSGFAPYSRGGRPGGGLDAFVFPTDRSSVSGDSNSAGISRENSTTDTFGLPRATAAAAASTGKHLVVPGAPAASSSSSAPLSHHSKNTSTGGTGGAIRRSASFDSVLGIGGGDDSFSKQNSNSTFGGSSNKSPAVGPTKPNASTTTTTTTGTTATGGKNHEIPFIEIDAILSAPSSQSGTTGGTQQQQHLAPSSPHAVRSNSSAFSDNGLLPPTSGDRTARPSISGVTPDDGTPRAPSGNNSTRNPSAIDSDLDSVSSNDTAIAILAKHNSAGRLKDTTNQHRTFHHDVLEMSPTNLSLTNNNSTTTINNNNSTNLNSNTVVATTANSTTTGPPPPLPIALHNPTAKPATTSTTSLVATTQRRSSTPPPPPLPINLAPAAQHTGPVNNPFAKNNIHDDDDDDSDDPLGLSPPKNRNTTTTYQPPSTKQPSAPPLPIPLNPSPATYKPPPPLPSLSSSSLQQQHQLLSPPPPLPISLTSPTAGGQNNKNHHVVTLAIDDDDDDPLGLSIKPPPLDSASNSSPPPPPPLPIPLMARQDKPSSNILSAIGIAGARPNPPLPIPLSNTARQTKETNSLFDSDDDLL